MRHLVSCAVRDCPTTSRDKTAKFFKVPQVSKKYGDLGKLWKEFSRRKSLRSDHWRFCHLHFAPGSYKEGDKKRLRIKRGLVPTIFYKNGEKIVVPYNKDYQKYYGRESEYLYLEIEQEMKQKEQQVAEHEKDLLDRRQTRLVDIKNLCRFCFESSKKAKCIEMKAFESYEIDPMEIIKFFGCSMDYNATFSDIICESCFVVIIEFHNLRKKCIERQQDLIKELNKLDQKIQHAQKMRKSTNETLIPWFDVQLGSVPDQSVQSTFVFDSTANIIESATDLDQSFVSMTEFNESIIKQEPPVGESDQEFYDDDAMDHENANFDSDDGSENYALSHFVSQMKVEKVENFAEAPKIDNSIMNLTMKTEEPLKSEKPKSLKEQVKRRPRESQKDKTFECFFCREKFLGKLTMRQHNCPIKYRPCDVPGCSKKFPNQASHGQHMVRIHGLPKISAQYCPGCKSYLQMNPIEFKEHTKNCEGSKEMANKPAKCEICKKICKNLEAYTAHKLFHSTKNLIESVDSNGVKTYSKQGPGEKERICDLCGKILSDYKSLRKHKVNIHLVDFKGKMFCCDLCGVEKNTKNLLSAHMKSVHIINWQRCSYCSKDFKSKRLLRRHILYMHERHRLNIRCHICPHKPGFNARVYLEQHMRQHHGENSAKQLGRFRCDHDFCEASYASQKTLDQHKVDQHGYYYSWGTNN